MSLIGVTSINAAPLNGSVQGIQRSAGQTESPGSLGDAFGQFVRNTNQDQVVADQAVQQLVEGKTDNVQQVVLAMAQAEMSFQLFMEIRNKLTETYSELMRMQF